MKILKHKKILIVFCLILICISLFTFSVSAFSTVNSVDYLTESSGFAVTAPGLIDVSVLGSTTTDGVPDYYSVAANFSPIINLYDYNLQYTQVDDTISYGSWRGFTMPETSDIELFGDTNFYIGTANFYYSSYRFMPDADLQDLNFAVHDTVMHLRDFYCWNYNFEGISSDNELSLSFDYETTDIRVNQLVVKYALAGSTQIDQIIIEASYYDELTNGIINLTPEMLGYHDENLLVYIYDCEIHFTGVPTSYRSTLYTFNVTYTLNPHISNFAGFDPNENPALALTPFATWIGDAVSGFMDFELFKGFSLGGIFVTIVAFLCVVWFLKLVAGG